MSWIMTYSGVQFDLLNPKTWQVRIADIAHALSQNCRYTGHPKFFYSVAQHCLLGAYLMKENGYSSRLRLLFALHDAAETWYNDIATPLKRLLLDYVEMEDKALDIVWAAFGIEPPTEEEWAIVKFYDKLMLSNEIPKLMPFPEQFNVELRYDDIGIVEMNMKDVEALYVNLIWELLHEEINKKEVTHV